MGFCPPEPISLFPAAERRTIEISERVAVLLDQICLLHGDQPVDVVEDLILQLGAEVAAHGDDGGEGT